MTDQLDDLESQFAAMVAEADRQANYMARANWAVEVPDAPGLSWNLRFLTAMAAMHLDLSPEPDSPWCIMAPLPTMEAPGLWPGGTYMVDRKPSRVADLITQLMAL